MTLEVVEEGLSFLAEYATVPIHFRVTESFDADAIDQLRRGERPAAVPVRSPYIKDYDAYSGQHPTDWPKRFDISGWIFLAAYVDKKRVGGAVVAVDDPQLEVLRAQPGVGVLWDMRVAPDLRRQGVGSALLRAAEDAAARHGARALRVETQQVNVAACRLYQRHGFSLEYVSPGAYASLPDEIQLVWIKSLLGVSPKSRPDYILMSSTPRGSAR